jgi:hypothetical protein
MRKSAAIVGVSFSLPASTSVALDCEEADIMEANANRNSGVVVTVFDALRIDCRLLGRGGDPPA